eukprot:409305-Rhodomonas_salina.1
MLTRSGPKRLPHCARTMFCCAMALPYCSTAPPLLCHDCSVMASDASTCNHDAVMLAHHPHDPDAVNAESRWRIVVLCSSCTSSRSSGPPNPRCANV